MFQISQFDKRDIELKKGFKKRREKMIKDQSNSFDFGYQN